MSHIRGLKTKDYLVREIILIKKEDNGLSAKEVREELIKRHPGSKSVPKERAIYKIIERNRGKIVPDKLDKPWTMGSCLEYDISADVVVPIQRQLLLRGLFLTIRRARWYSKLHPILCPLLEEHFSGQSVRNQTRLFQIASYYTRTEQIAKINGEDYPDTQALDKTFLIDQDFSIKASRRIWDSLYRSVLEKPSKEMEEKASEFKGEEMTEDEERLFNRFTKIEGDLEKELIFIEENPNIEPLVEDKMAFNLRRNIKISTKEGAK